MKVNFKKALKTVGAALVAVVTAPIRWARNLFSRKKSTRKYGDKNDNVVTKTDNDIRLKSVVGYYTPGFLLTEEEKQKFPRIKLTEHEKKRMPFKDKWYVTPDYRPPNFGA